jgi:hypothetical protein
MSFVVRGAKSRRKQSTISERVTKELQRLAIQRAKSCAHRFATSPNVRGSICIDCGVRR